MKSILILLLSVVTLNSWAQEGMDSVFLQEYKEYYAYVDSLEKHLSYDSGMVMLGESLATAMMPEGYRYLDPQETNKILVDSWGNPPTTTLGMIVPKDVNPYSFEGWGVVITYEEDGHIDDEDASDIDFDELLEIMQEDVQEENEVRVREGYEPYQLGGWAEDPYYDPATHQLYWALELQFGHEDEAVSTLNYNVRVLGRKGVLVLNAVSGMEQFAEVREHMTDIQGFTSFTEGNRYTDYNPSIDRAATYGIGALVAGKLAAKTGFFKIAMAFFAKGWKFILLALAAAGAFIRRALSGGGKEKKDALS